MKSLQTLVLLWIVGAMVGSPPGRAATTTVRVGDERVPDPGRWLEHSGRKEVEEWWQARAAADRAWMNAGADVAAIEALLAQTRATRPGTTSLRDHRAGVSVWQQTEWVEAAPPSQPSRWLTHITIQQPGDEWPGTELLPSDEQRTGSLCLVVLAPEGQRLLVGRRPALQDLSPEEREEPQRCPIEVVDLPTGTRRGLGTWQWPQATWAPGEQEILLKSGWGRQGSALTWIDPNTGATREAFRSRRAPISILRQGDTLVGLEGRRSRPWRKPRILFGDPYDPDGLAWLGQPLRRPWFGGAQMVGWTGEDLLLLTDWFGEGNNVIRVDPAEPLWSEWRVPVEERPGMDLHQAALHSDDLLLVWSQGGRQHLEVRPYSGGPGAVVDLGLTAASVRVWRATQDTAVIEAHNPVEARWYARSSDGGMRLLHQQKLENGLEFEVVEIEADDGVRVPVSLVHPAGPPQPGGWPMLLDVYGGFGQSQSMVGLSAADRVWLSAGGARGMIHARGGREFGDDWHETARLEHLGRRFDDVIAVARGLVAQGIAAAGRVGITGSSNGGLTVAAAVARDPAAFGAVVGQAGVYDLLRAPRFGRWWPDEYGQLNNTNQAVVLRAESPVHRIPQGPLPPVLLVTGQVDPVVAPAHTYKLAAAWADLPGGPVLLLVDPLGSHGGDPNDTAFHDEGESDALTAVVLAFLSRALGVTLPAEPAVAPIAPGDAPSGATGQGVR